jgi:AraC-like DNA-binding protein
MPELRQAVDEYLRRCFSSEATPRVSELATLLGVPREKLSRAFAALHGISLSAYLKHQQLAYAERLLVSSRLSTTRIGYLAGFGTRRTFYRAFRRDTGMSPDQYRRINARKA